MIWLAPSTASDLVRGFDLICNTTNLVGWCTTGGITTEVSWFSWNSSLTVKPTAISDLRPEMNVSEQVESNHKLGLAEMPRNHEVNVEFVTFPKSSRKSEQMNR